MLRTLVASLAFSSVLLIVSAAGASTWVVSLKPASFGETQSQAAPAAPADVTSACTSLFGTTMTVTWDAVDHATSYTVYESTTSATGPYSPVASGIGGLSWTTPSLASGDYWFEVGAYVGSNWVSENSAATAEHYIVLGLICL